MSGEFSQVKESLVEKILEQGQRLRNAMVQSILQNDPLSSNIIYNKNCVTPAASCVTLEDKPAGDKKLIEAFLSGDYLTKYQEEVALNTIRSMPLLDVCAATERTLSSKCSCATCNAYHTNTLKCDLRRSPYCNKKHSAEYKENIFNCAQILKQVDSLKVILQSIHLNSLGNKKVTQGLNEKQFGSGLNETYFVEYYLPEVFTREVPKSKSKTDSGLESNHVRVCARRISSAIHIRQIIIHTVCNLYNCNLEDHDLIFFIKYKTTRQKKSELLGIAKFNLGLFKDPRNVSCAKSLPVYLNEESSITVGTLKVTLQLGAGKLYFGQEFLDAVLSQKSPLDTDSSDEIIDAPNYKKPFFEDVVAEKRIRKQISTEKVEFRNKPVHPVVQQEGSHSAHFQQSKSEEIEAHPIADKKEPIHIFSKKIEEEILFGFIYISEAQFLNFSPSSFILCQPYCQSDTSSSKVVYNSSNPLYNLFQTLPLLYGEDLLLKLRENFMVIEFWEKSGQTEQLFGLTRLPLHQFYLGYRNTIILKHLKRNKLPIIGTDWWEPVYSVENNELIGQVQVLTALGTEEQIGNLELERGFKDDIVKAKFGYVTQAKKELGVRQPSSYFGDRAKVNRQPLKPVDTKRLTRVNNPIISLSKTKETLSNIYPPKFDVGIQSDLDKQMDSKDNSSKSPQTQDMLASFLKILEQKQRPPCVENSTNTENGVCSGTSIQEPKTEQQCVPQLRKTSDLLDSLEKALSLDNRPIKKDAKPPHFRAQIRINGANQLPCRRKLKSKSKRVKGKSPKQEDNVLPSTYVTFETMPGEPLRITSVFPKSTSPQWSYTCEVSLPMDLVTNDQKRLIFKVWKKCTNAVLQPNMQTDLVLGFAAVDLSVLSCGLPNVQGWFNIIDFSGKCNGQINIHVNPLEKIEKMNSQNPNIAENVNSNSLLSHQIPENEECNELLSRALKRKFTELDEITQRLRLRLSEVITEDSEGSNDDITEEFESDINNLCIEEDYDLINFEEEARKFNINYNNHKTEQKEKSNTTNIFSNKPQPGTSQQREEKSQDIMSDQDIDADKLKSGSSGLLMDKEGSGNSTESSTSRSLFSDKNLLEGKHRIDSLLEKLSLINAEASQPFSSRYVSGCSVASTDANDIQDIFRDLDQQSRPNITAGNSFDPVVFEELCGESVSNGSAQNSNPSGSNIVASGSSETSVITNFSDCRPIPDGQGTSSEDKRT